MTIMNRSAAPLWLKKEFPPNVAYAVKEMRKDWQYVTWTEIHAERTKKQEAYLSIRTWTGAAYKSKQKEVFRLHKEDGIGIESLDVLPFGNHVGAMTWIDESALAKNDGLRYEDFKEWFKSYDSETMVIIHFTDFRYSN